MLGTVEAENYICVCMYLFTLKVMGRKKFCQNKSKREEKVKVKRK